MRQNILFQFSVVSFIQVHDLCYLLFDEKVKSHIIYLFECCFLRFLGMKRDSQHLLFAGVLLTDQSQYFGIYQKVQPYDISITKKQERAL